MNQEFLKDIQRFLQMSFDSHSIAISSEEEFASERGWLTHEQEANMQARHKKEFPEHIKRMKALWKYIRKSYPDDVEHWAKIQFETLDTKIHSASQGSDGAKPLGIMVAVYQSSRDRLKALLNGKISDKDLTLIYNGIIERKR